MSRAKNAFILIFIIKGLIMSSIANSTAYFGVDIDLHNVAVDIRVNDIPAYFDEKKGQLSVEIASPESIVDGLNSLSLSVFLPYDSNERSLKFEEGAYATVTLFQQDLGVTNSEKNKLISATLKLEGDGVLAMVENHITKEKSTPEISLSKESKAFIEVTTQIKSPFPRWAWQDGKTIEDNKENYDSLLEAYKDIHSAMKTKDLNKVQNLYSLRAKEIASAYGLADESAGQEKLSTGKDMVNPNLELYEFHTDGMTLNIIGNGRLARIVDMDNDQPILFYEPKADLVHLYKFMFYLNKDNQWIMIR